MKINKINTQLVLKQDNFDLIRTSNKGNIIFKEMTYNNI